MDEKRILVILAGLIGIVLVLFGLYAIGASARSNGEIDYCYVEMWSPPNMSPQYQLHGHRPWRQDRILGNYPTMDVAIKEAELMQCPLNKK